MPFKDTSEIKNKIISILKLKGPSLPVHIARETGMSMLFSSAFLAELLSEKKIKISYMKVGSSPIYYLPGQEHLLEIFSQYLKSREKEAFELLKSKRFLKDSEQEPAIRVALRYLRDFAIPFKDDDKIYWRYFNVREDEFIEKPKVIEKPKKELEKEKDLDIFEKPTKKEKPKQKIKPKTKKTDEFFNKIKEFLNKNSIEFINIEEFSKNQISIKARKNEKEILIVAFNKKRISENDIIKADKKSSELNISYLILSLGEPLKKLDNLIKAIKNLFGIKKL